jgi:tRNA (adenine37-N6)-methyltransferase
MFTMRPIGYVRSPHQETSAIPKGPDAKHEAEGSSRSCPSSTRGFRTSTDSRTFVIWVFHAAEPAVLVSIPPTDDRPHGVFAGRSPRRPNPLGLTVVELLGREGNRLRVRGLDMLDGTPILDIKPYLTSVPPEKLRRGWLAEAEERRKKGGG